ncbi:MAG: hypothetical protein ABSF69_21755 [Polyangiaceae bacterium]
MKQSAVGMIVAAAAALSGCSSARSTSVETTGTLSVPLSVTTNGSTYILANASIYIYPSFCCAGGTVITTGGDGGTAEFTTTLQTGSWYADLYNWTLEREDPLGGFDPVVATLTSSNYVPFTIDNGTTTTVTFTFQTDGVTVTTGSGTLNVGIAVNQTDAACTPFGDDCAAGSWCPPASLTAADLACVVAGTVALGQPCTEPLDCVANAACFTVGDAGAVCAALCPGSDVNLPCSTGGTCQSATSADYGICLPDSTGGGDAGDDSSIP